MCDQPAAEAPSENQMHEERKRHEESESLCGGGAAAGDRISITESLLLSLSQRPSWRSTERKVDMKPKRRSECGTQGPTDKRNMK